MANATATSKTIPRTSTAEAVAILYRLTARPQRQEDDSQRRQADDRVSEDAGELRLGQLLGDLDQHDDGGHEHGQAGHARRRVLQHFRRQARREAPAGLPVAGVAGSGCRVGMVCPMIRKAGPAVTRIGEAGAYNVALSTVLLVLK